MKKLKNNYYPPFVKRIYPPPCSNNNYALLTFYTYHCNSLKTQKEAIRNRKQYQEQKDETKKKFLKN